MAQDTSDTPGGTWNDRVVHGVHEVAGVGRIDTYYLVEAYYEPGVDVPTSFSQGGRPVGTSLEDLAGDLENMTRALSLPVIEEADLPREWLVADMLGAVATPGAGTATSGSGMPTDTWRDRVLALDVALHVPEKAVGVKHRCAPCDREFKTAQGLSSHSCSHHWLEDACPGFGQSSCFCTPFVPLQPFPTCSERWPWSSCSCSPWSP